MMLFNCAANQVMLTSPATTPRTLCRRLPWLAGTVRVIGSWTVGARTTWYGESAPWLNCDRIVASSSWLLVLPVERAPPSPKPGVVGGGSGLVTGTSTVE